MYSQRFSVVTAASTKNVWKSQVRRMAEYKALAERYDD
jgi:hypothetical protein